jgi:hypothetical protein
VVIMNDFKTFTKGRISFQRFSKDACKLRASFI